jgi:hypothetical protein
MSEQADLHKIKYSTFEATQKQLGEIIMRSTYRLQQKAETQRHYITRLNRNVGPNKKQLDRIKIAETKHKREYT